MEHSQFYFDVEDALSRLAEARLPILPHNIPNLVDSAQANEHEDLVVDPAPAPAPTVPQTGVQRLEAVPDARQLPLLNSVADLILDLNNFREAESRRILGVSSQDYVYNCQQEIISNLDAEDYIDSEPDEDYLQCDEEDEENEEDSTMEYPEFPPPANDASPESSPDLQMQEAEHEFQGERRSEKPCLWTVGFVINVKEAVAQVQYCDSVPQPVNAEGSVQAQRSNPFPEAVSMGSLPNDPTPMIEEGHIHEIIMHVNPSSSEIRTLAASPTSTSMLPETSDTIRICDSSLELPTLAAHGRISGGIPVQKPAATASVSEGESLLKLPGA